MSIKKGIILLSLTSFILPANLYAQDTTNFFPHHIGDMWEYYFTDYVGSDTIQVFVIEDSLDPDGNHHVIQTARSINPIAPPIFFFWDTTKYIIDTTNQVLTYFCFGTGEPLVKYKLDAQAGDQWVIWGEPGYYEMARVMSVIQDTLFGIPTVSKVYKYYSATDSTDTTGLVMNYDVLADGFGLIYGAACECGLWIFLRGAIIDGVYYGDTTLVSINDYSLAQIPDKIKLFQNYPNPFNPQTTIRFNVKNSNRISLSIYNSVGREVGRLIDNQWYPVGEHEIIWNGKTEKIAEVASGVYFYRLSVGQQTITRKMLLIR